MAARIVLAFAFAVAAVAKLVAPATTRRVAAALVGPRAAPLIVWFVPAVELGLAVALVGWWWAPGPAVGAIVALAAFTVVLVRAELRHLPCPCFGGIGRERAAGPAAVVRNGLLLAEAVVATASAVDAQAGATIVAATLLGALTLGVVAWAR
ncbi:MAG TPA: MauE/DoxX family redox-associated membrane protein [Acidimicrobiia bacterium]|nr:MauE/DoxX family redox-associated membrane protein [Acidimicrobiia bacterium]